MREELSTKQQVQDFYNQIGWQQIGDGLYQNARYEDLRPVAREYIQCCHLRVKRFLSPTGDLLLDAGSGPIQWPAYLTYSEGYRYRVCADISILALKEARQRLGERGLYVVADVANLPFKSDAFDGVVSLHAIHHVPFDEQINAYQQVYRVLKPGCSAAVVNSWKSSQLMQRMFGLMRAFEMARYYWKRLGQRLFRRAVDEAPATSEAAAPTGTYTRHYDADLLEKHFGEKHIPLEIRPWRSVSVRFLRATMHPWLGGTLWLKLIFWLEDRFPHYFGRHGQYPLLVIRKK